MQYLKGYADFVFNPDQDRKVGDRLERFRAPFRLQLCLSVFVLLLLRLL